jgi:putative flippase GtrA
MKIPKLLGAHKTFMRLFISRQFVIFLITGGISALANFLSRILYNAVVTFPVAIALAYITGMVVAFILAKIYVFTESSHSLAKSAILFTAVNLLGFIQAWIVSMVLEYHILPAIGIHQFDKSIATLVGISVPAFTSFIGYKYISFKKI